MLRLRFRELLLPARLLDAEIADENQRNRGRRELDCFLPHRSDLKSDCICMPIITVSYLYQKFSGKINLAFTVVLGHRLKRTSAKFHFVRNVIDSLFICHCLRLLYVDSIVLDL